MPLEIPKYIDELIESEDVLPHSEQAALAELALGGCMASRDKLVLSNLRMVMREIRALGTVPKRLECSDVFNAGVEGLLEALNRFDCNRDIKFMTYAYWWVKKKVLQAVYDNLSIIHVPKEQIKALERMHALCEKKIQRVKTVSPSASVPYTALEMAEEIFGPEDRGSFIRLQCAFMAFDVDDHDCDDFGHIDLSTMDDNEEDLALSEYLENLMHILDEREEDIVKRFFGIGCKSQDYDEIGRFYILTPERIRQIVQVALQKMQEGAPGSIEATGGGMSYSESSPNMCS